MAREKGNFVLNDTVKVFSGIKKKNPASTMCGKIVKLTANQLQTKRKNCAKLELIKV